MPALIVIIDEYAELPESAPDAAGDADSILGQGMLAAGSHSHTVNAPGKFLVSAPEYDTPHRARAYLINNEAAAVTAARHAPIRPDDATVPELMDQTG